MKLRIGIPDLSSYSARRGIGRAVTTLVTYWHEWGHEIISIPSRSTRVPVFRNLKWGLSGSLQNVDVLFQPNFFEAVILFFLPKNFPSVTMVYDLGLLDCPEDRAEASLLSLPLFKLALRVACRVKKALAISDFTHQRLIWHAPCLSEKVETIHLGVDNQVFRPHERSSARQFVRRFGLPFQLDDFVLIYVGEEYARKNILTLAQVVAQLKDQMPGVKLIKAGKAHNPSNRQQTLAALQTNRLIIGQDIFFIDEINDYELCMLYNCANVFLTTSKYEGFGLPLLEALACGLPAVVSNVAALPEIGGKAARYASPDHPEQYVQQLLRIAVEDQSPRQTSLEQAAQFSWEKCASQVLQALVSI